MTEGPAKCSQVDEISEACDGYHAVSSKHFVYLFVRTSHATRHRQSMSCTWEDIFVSEGRLSASVLRIYLLADD